jgi:hypothetical protein
MNKFLQDLQKTKISEFKYFGSYKGALKVFIRDCNGKLFIDRWSLSTLKYHLNKQGGKNMKCTEYVGLVANNGNLIGKYEPKNFKW